MVSLTIENVYLVSTRSGIHHSLFSEVVSRAFPTQLGSNKVVPILFS